MKNQLRTYFAAALLVLVCAAASAQSSSKMYTRKVRLADFPSRTTKVVVDGQSLLALTLKDEISARWTVSPFEFCSLAEYETLRQDNGYYFLRLVSDEGVNYLSLSKGGKDGEQNNLTKPFEVVRIAIGREGDDSGREFAFLGAFTDIVQSFVQDAMQTDIAGYAGLKAYNKLNLEGRSIIFDEDEGDEAMVSQLGDVLVALVISPQNISFDTYCYKMLVSPDTHELFYYVRKRYTGPRDREFTERELKRFTKRNGITSE